MNEITDGVERLFMSCKKQLQRDQAFVRELQKQADIAEALRQYMVINRLEDDDLTLFNWFIGTTFNISVNELRKMK